MEKKSFDPVHDIIHPCSYRTDRTVEGLKRSLVENLCYVQGRLPRVATANDWYMALAYTVRDQILQRWMETMEGLLGFNVKSVGYLSAEFLMGPHLMNNIVCLGIEEPVRACLRAVGRDLDELAAVEQEPGLGNGGLGRLAACFLDSLATLEYLAVGYGIRYEFGIFDQVIRDGWQAEITDEWLLLGNPWEIGRPELSFEVKFGGRCEPCRDEAGDYRVRWIPDSVVRGIAYDTPVPGYRVGTVNLLRLWRAVACRDFDFQAFNTGDYYRAVNEKIVSENISKVLYPNDEAVAGRRLRLSQQYLLVCCSLQDMIRVHLMRGNPIGNFDAKYAVQLNDTHPAVAVAELMRLLVDEHGLRWEEAWRITRGALAYTNHTLLPEALERWPVQLFASLLPRHLEIIYEINRRFLEEVRARFPGDEERVARLSLIDETGERFIRMAHLAVVGSHAVNGVAALHTQLLRTTVLRDFNELWPERFLNITNGVTPRRWVLVSNPRLASLITEAIGEGWISDMAQLERLEPLAGDSAFQRRWREIKLGNKRVLAGLIRERTGIAVDPGTLFDMQVKRIHEYKRQHLNVLHIVTLYNRLRRDPSLDLPLRTFVFGGKAAPGYAMAKLIIKLITSVGAVVNADPTVDGRLKVVFYPDFNVKNAQPVYPAADLSEQISTAGKEASGTGNMKFALNGALTIGTLDGANVEIREAVGGENFFLFGLTVPETLALKAGGYDPAARCHADSELREAVELIGSGHFSGGDAGLFRPLIDALLGGDEYLLFADYRSYIAAQERVGLLFGDELQWTRASILNVARSGRFSADRAIRDYAQRVWGLEPQS